MNNFERIQDAVEAMDDATCITVHIVDTLRGEIDEWASDEEQAAAVRAAYEGLTLEDLERITADAERIRHALTLTLRAMRAHPSIRRARR
jgi:hypothetical protein